MNETILHPRQPPANKTLLPPPPACSRCRDERLRAYQMGLLAGYRRGLARLRVVGDEGVRR